MPNIWKENQNVNENPNRNNFDLSFQNHLTMKMGTLYPVFCKEVVPGDSFKIDTAIGLKFMPLVFPVQSRMRAHMHYFYVRNKNLWKGWENWLSGLKSDTHPYISQPAEFFKTGSLADYLDIPTTVVSPASEWQNVAWKLNDPLSGTASKVDIIRSDSSFNFSSKELSTSYTGGAANNASSYSHIGAIGVNSYISAAYFNVTAITSGWLLGMQKSVIEQDVDLPIVHETDLYSKHFFFETPILNCPVDVDSDHAGTSYIGALRLRWNDRLPSYFDKDEIRCSVQIWRCGQNESIDSATLCAVYAADDSNSLVNDGYCDFFHALGDLNSGMFDTSLGYRYYMSIMLTYDINYNVVVGSVRETGNVGDRTVFMVPRQIGLYAHVDGIADSPSNTPFSSSADRIRLSALPFRAYQSCYNAFYRNFQNQPFVVDGEEVFNQYITTDASGADTTPYELYRRNYEMDYLTSCLPSPQQGIAPLVGMTALGNVTIEDENGITTAHAEIDNDGTITKVTLTSPAASIEHARTAMNIASSGMSINDFRNVNALQRWLETNIRKGYKYRDFIAGHFGKEPEYRELDMPEFIGGFSEQVTVGTVTNMSDTSGIGDNDAGKVLGEFAGTASCFASSGHSVTHYCDDYGFIIGILCVVPDPSYSQLLPKQWLKSEPLDYYFPEFSHLGMQPITYREVCPVQAYQDELADSQTYLENTFGYQRPNYDLVGYTDQVHGQFRTTLRNFLINRVFAGMPQLGTEFLEINPAEVNDIFAYTAPAEDNIIGQIVFDVKAKRPVPRVTIPSLGR